MEVAHKLYKKIKLIYQDRARRALLNLYLSNSISYLDPLQNSKYSSQSKDPSNDIAFVTVFIVGMQKETITNLFFSFNEIAKNIWSNFSHILHFY